MNTREIEILLERYFEGQTTIAEEKALSDFFTAGEVPSHLQAYIPLFSYFRDEAGVKLSNPDFEKRFESAIDTDTTTVPLYPARNRRWLPMAIAASVLLLAGLFLTLRNDILRQPAPVTMTEAEINQAFTDTKNALIMVSAGFNQGIGHAQHFDALDHALRQMNSFNKFYQLQSQIINPDAILDRPKNK